MADVQASLNDYICKEILFDDESRVPGPEDPLLGAGGVVDSVGLHQLIEFLESNFGIKVEDLDIMPENFETMNALVAYVEKKQVVS